MGLPEHLPTKGGEGGSSHLKPVQGRMQGSTPPCWECGVSPGPGGGWEQGLWAVSKDKCDHPHFIDGETAT